MYVTIDRWDSEEAFDAFMDTMGDEYEQLDRRLAALTEDEQPVLIGHAVDEDQHRVDEPG